MARNQEFNTQDALEQAMRVFWDKGYKGASLNILLDAMDIGKGSFYATFGSKYALFLEALKLYRLKYAMVCEMRNIMHDLPAKKAIERVLVRVVDRIIEDKRCCMLGKTALEFLQSDAVIAEEIEAGVKQVEETFKQLVIRGQINQEISAEKDPELMAYFLTSVFYGLQITGSATQNRLALEGVIVSTLTLLD